MTDGADWIQGFVDLHRPDAVRILDIPHAAEHLNLLIEALLQYPVYQQHGWPIGSGIVESANKVIVQAWLKGAGMHWEPAHVNPTLALRSAVCSEPWDEAWQDTIQQHRSLLHTKRQQVATTRFQSQLASLLLLRFCPTPPKPVPPSPRSVHPAASLHSSCRPSASHPWKRAPACLPKFFAKK